MQRPDRVPQQDPQPEDPGQINPKIPGIDDPSPSDTPRPQSDPGKQPIA